VLVIVYYCNVRLERILITVKYDSSINTHGMHRKCYIDVCIYVRILSIYVDPNLTRLVLADSRKCDISHCHKWIAVSVYCCYIMQGW
jgi:hypothetical protein